jgi:alkylated DNA repair dioxygenase AlkB
MEKLTSVEFEEKVSPRVAMEAVIQRGACAIHNFATVEQLQPAAELLRSQRMILDEDMTARVQRRQHMNEFTIGAEETPDVLASLAGEVWAYVNRGDFAWEPNEIIAHRYDTDDFIGRHRDYTEALGLIAVLTLDGMQDFYVELDGDEKPTKVTMRPGTLTMLRGFNGNPETRPYHWVGRPAAQRTALSIRHMRHVWTPKPDEVAWD